MAFNLSAEYTIQFALDKVTAALEHADYIFSNEHEAAEFGKSQGLQGEIDLKVDYLKQDELAEDVLPRKKEEPFVKLGDKRRRPNDFDQGETLLLVEEDGNIVKRVKID